MKSNRKLLCCLLTLLLTAFGLNCICSLSSAEEIVFEYVPGGWEAPSSGFWMDEPTGRLIFEALKSLRLERDAYKEGYEAAKSNSAELAADIKQAVKARSFGLGVFGGVSHSGEGVIGAGVVWKIF